eukprot:9349635-Pyramimonas_sp.AAC.1
MNEAPARDFLKVQVPEPNSEDKFRPHEPKRDATHKASTAWGPHREGAHGRDVLAIRSLTRRPIELYCRVKPQEHKRH